MIIGSVLYAHRVNKGIKVLLVNNPPRLSKTKREPIQITVFTLDLSRLDGTNILA